MKRILTASAVIAALATVLPALGPARAAETSDRFTEKGLITVCADPYIYPASAQGYPPGYDVDIIRKIAEDGGYRVEHVWVDTGTRGGLGKAIRNSIAKGLCDVFLGIGVNDLNIDELAEKDLVFTDPYLGLAFILVVQGQAANASTLDDLKASPCRRRLTAICSTMDTSARSTLATGASCAAWSRARLTRR